MVAVKSADNGNVDVADLMLKAEKHKDNLSCLMITYPSTYGVFEEAIKEMVDIVHDRGGQVRYLHCTHVLSALVYCIYYTAVRSTRTNTIVALELIL